MLSGYSLFIIIIIMFYLLLCDLRDVYISFFTGGKWNQNCSVFIQCDLEKLKRFVGS
jgi:hypothetical protein